MGFTTFKNNYLSKVDSGGFKTSDETAEFIASEYDKAVSLPTSMATATGPIATSGGGTTALENYLKTSFAAGTLPPVLEAGLLPSLSTYWTGVITSLAFTTVPVAGVVGLLPAGNLIGSADTSEDFLDQLIGAFEMHLSGIGWLHSGGVTVDTGWTVL